MDNNFRKDRYTIGAHIIEKSMNPQILEGIYTFGTYGFAYITKDKEDLFDSAEIYVVDGYENAQKMVQFLSRRYRYEFRHNSKKMKKDMSEFRFYPMKLTKPFFDDFEFDWDNAKTMRSDKQFWGDPYKVRYVKIKEKVKNAPV